MAAMKKLSILVLCIALSLVFLLSENQASGMEISTSQHRSDDLLYGVTEGSLRPQECGSRCSNRCSATAFKKPCLFFCQKCCAKCLCVPPGTYGNKQVCPCYNNWKTKRGGPKCP